MLYSLTGFPFDLLWGILFALLYKPKFHPIILITAGLIIPAAGLLIPLPYQVMYWTPGGAATVAVTTVFLLHSLTHDVWLKDKRVDLVKDRGKIREELFLIESMEERQQAYMHQIQKISIAFENNNNTTLQSNTFFFLTSFIALFILDFSALAILHFMHPDLMKDLFAEVYQAIALNPGTFSAWFSDLLSLSALHIFILNIIFFLILLGIIDRILSRRNLRLPVIGNPAFFQMPFYSVWIYILSGILFFAAIKAGYTGLPLYITKNLFFILSSLFVFQGISILWLFLQVRLLPAAAITSSLFLFAFMFQLFTVLIFSSFLLLGLLDFWFDFRKKALHPNLFSDGV